LNSCCVLQDHYDDECDKIVFHHTTPDLQDQDQDHSVQDQDQFFFVSDRSCPKNNGLGPHHWQLFPENSCNCPYLARVKYR